MVSWRHIEYVVKSYADMFPLDVFAFLGSFVEEIIPPIPAPLVMTTVGSLSLTQHHGWMFLVWLAIAGSVGKTLASWIFYVVGDKLEHAAIGKFGKFVGIDHRDVESIGKRFNGGWGDDIVLFILRSIPVFPSVSVSIVCGIIRMNPRTFIGATFLGTIVKNGIYLYAGYGGMRAIGMVARRIHDAHFIIGTVFVVVALAIIYRLVHHTRKKRNEAEE